MINKVVLLDRDGTIIIDPPDERVTSTEKIKLFPDSISALKNLADFGFSAIIITNQAGMGEGMINEEEFHRLHAEILHQLAPSGLPILKTYICPHAKNDGCECRKPKPTMINDAVRDFHLDTAKLFMIGDHNSDVVAAKAAGIKAVLVQTATNGQDESHSADFIAKDLNEAADYIVSH